MGFFSRFQNGHRHASYPTASQIVTSPSVAGGANVQAALAKMPVVYRVSVDDSDIPTTGSRLDLLTLPVGASLLAWWVDPDTFIPWDFDVGMGQGPEWEAFDLSGAPAYTTIPGFLGEPAHGSDPTGLDFVSSKALYQRQDRAGVQQDFTSLLHISAAGPIQVASISSGSVIGGHFDIEFLVVVPVAL